MFGNSTIGLLLLITHILACITVGIIFRFWKFNSSSPDYIGNKNSNYKKYKNVTFSNLGEVLGKSITNSISTILMIGGFVVIFSSIISILKASGILHSLVLMLIPIFDFLHIDNSFISGTFTVSLFSLVFGAFVIFVIYQHFYSETIYLNFEAYPTYFIDNKLHHYIIQQMFQLFNSKYLVFSSSIFNILCIEVQIQV